MASSTYLVLERPRPGVALITLDNPEQRNAMSGPMTAAFADAVAALRADLEVRAVVVTGRGSAFCSGGDTEWLVAEPDATVADLRAKMIAFYRAWLSITTVEVPTIAAVNGAAIGAGLCLALACDLRYLAEPARLGVPFVKLGLHPGMAGTHLLPAAVGLAVARDLLLTGRLVDADEAVRIGLAAGAWPADGFLDAVLDRAEEIAQNAPVATRLTTLALREQHHDIEAALQWEALAQPITMATADLREGIAAARERRRPRFTGR